LDFIWETIGIVGLIGGVFLGLSIGSLGVWLLRTEALWRAVPALVILVLIAVYVPWTTRELGEYQAVRDIRRHELPQAIIEFKEEAPAPIRRSHDATRTELVSIVLVTGDRLAVAYPFGCKSIGEPQSVSLDTPDGNARSEICDIFLVDRGDVSSMRILGKNTERPFNDERSKPDIVKLSPVSRTDYDETLDLTAARKDECPPAVAGDANAKGVWLLLDAQQSGRLSIRNSTADVFAEPVGTRESCWQLSEDSGVMVSAGERLLVLASSSKEGDTSTERLAFTFEPLEFRVSDCRMSRESEATQCAAVNAGSFNVPFVLAEQSTVSVQIDVESLPTAVPVCSLQERPVFSIAAAGTGGAVHPLCAPPPAQPSTGGEVVPAGSITLSLAQALDAGTWEARLDLTSLGVPVQSVRIRATPIGGCHASYPTVCVRPPPPDLDCTQIPYTNFPVVGADPHGFDPDRDGIGCESTSRQ
jgi:hypothetical protein